ncbi:MAG: hypothetical protein AMS18_04340 [Gemmatimonas sp. SG8_17]|nr:MAG: hypothetical protein AMS18_04340 [Gemmatimonas sp. SG8_17]
MCTISTHNQRWFGSVTRIHILLDEAEKERYRRRAERAGMSLGAWLRQAAQEKLAAEQSAIRLETVAELRAFFASCDEREPDKEPDWADHRRVIESSQQSGLTPT